jgi:hypothetical protein
MMRRILRVVGALLSFSKHLKKVFERVLAMEFVTRAQAVELLNRLGLPITDSQFHKLAWLRETPPKAGRWGRCDIYRSADVVAWAQRRLQGNSEAA